MYFTDGIKMCHAVSIPPCIVDFKERVFWTCILLYRAQTRFQFVSRFLELRMNKYKNWAHNIFNEHNIVPQF